MRSSNYVSGNSSWIALFSMLASTWLGCVAGEDATPRIHSEPHAGASGASRGGASAEAGAGGSNGTVAGRGGSGGNNPTAGSGGNASGGSNASAGAGGGTSGSGNGGSAGGSESNEVCARWKADRADMDEGSWSGNVSSCAAGDISESGRDNALRVLNLYRFLAGLPAVTTDDTRNKKAQACALIMHANDQLSHTPPNTWKCWSTDGSQAAGASNISPIAGVASVDLYMIDRGNATTLGHRRWILSNKLKRVGLGSTSEASCMWVSGDSGSEIRKWTAWPPPGKFPAEALELSRTKLDDTGWSLQSESIDLSEARVSVKENGTERAVDVTQLEPNYGAKYALRFNPKGWSTSAGKKYSVQVTNISTPIDYEVEVVDCDK